MDFRKIIDTLLIMAVGFLFSSIFSLNNSINELSTTIAVGEQREVSYEKERLQQARLLERITDLVEQNSKRLDKLEWDKQYGQATTR